MPSNRLADATSPYLLQHADNPVDWYPWGEEALQRAIDEDRPVLLSIGYSACHWCHVMAHESFEDGATAERMNRDFVCIKVDREERPDLDKIYQQAHQVLTGRPGGWPLTIFLSPGDQVPFFSGTYFPPRPRHGLPAFEQVLAGVMAAWGERRDQINAQNDQVAGMLQRGPGDGASAARPDAGMMRQAVLELAKSFDVQDGGFGAAPKFPHPESLNLLLRHARENPENDGGALQMADHTLTRMALGGIWDHVGGGFCRYSVDREWMIPHFEKMLYDNAALLYTYSEFWALSGDPLAHQRIEGIAAWVMREMQAADGGYCSSLDADSEGEEGRFYVWDRKQVRSVIGDADGSEFEQRFALDSTPNFEGRWHLHRLEDADPGPLPASQQELLQQLFAERSGRVPPGRDDKRLTSWNALMISGMAHAARLLGDAGIASSAESALTYLREQMWKDGRLLAANKDGYGHLNAYLDDYVYLVDALLEMLQLRWDPRDLEWARQLCDALLARFADPAGGFFFTSDDHERLLQRPKPLMDDALPAGNGVAVRVLSRLGYLLGESRYLEAAAVALEQAWSQVEALPHAHCSLIQGAAELQQPPLTVVIRTTGGGEEAMRRLARHAAGVMLIAIPADAAALPDALRDKHPEGDFVAYVCKGHECYPPVSDLDELEALLASGRMYGRD